MPSDELDMHTAHTIQSPFGEVVLERLILDVVEEVVEELDHVGSADDVRTMLLGLAKESHVWISNRCSWGGTGRGTSRPTSL